MLALLHHASAASYCISHGPMKWRNLISCLYISRNIDVFELWTRVRNYEMKIGNWGNAADCSWSNSSQSTVYIPIRSIDDNKRPPSSFWHFVPAYRLFTFFIAHHVHRSLVPDITRIDENMDPPTDYIFHRAVHSCLTLSRIREYESSRFCRSFLYLSLQHCPPTIAHSMFNSFQLIRYLFGILSKSAQNGAFFVMKLFISLILFDLDEGRFKKK